ncbi:hypothetical protein [Bradyrhizobium sp.]|uniref:hypothetical protein n=1 Tax=Bradyrhizobium sp. TaxID=376 RepID=UPI003D10A1FE
MGIRANRSTEILIRKHGEITAAKIPAGEAIHRLVESLGSRQRGNDMKKMLALIVLLYSAGAFAQNAPPAEEAEKPPAAEAVKPPARAKSHGTAPKSIAEKLQGCLELDDGTKDRLDCYDGVIPPKPKPKPPAAKGVMDCRFIQEQDERLGCFNGFAESIPKFSRR